ncbi:MAG TPA: ketopantoate reductase family protein [Candidatus Tumulicola sp.]|jgi:2-dehydropantoate 2-reductase
MRIGVLGAGAIGGFFGGRLLQAGRDVTFVVRPARAEALARDGLTIGGASGTVTLADPPTRPSGTGGKPFELILLACKAYDLEDAMESIAPSVGPSTAILPLLNGMRHLDVLRERFGDAAVLGGECFIAATLGDDGRVIQLAPMADITFGELDGDRSERLARVDSAIAGAGFETRVSATILADMWDKWVFLATNAGITCMMRGNVGEIVAAGGVATTLALLDECASIAAASGFPFSKEAGARAHALLTTPGSTLSASMFRDLQRGLRIENDHVIGDLLRRAPAASPPKILTAVAAHLNIYEARRG